MTPILSAPVQRRSFRPSVFVSPLGLWVAMAVVAVVNGIFRETMLVPRVGEYVGHVLSTAILIAAILALSSLYFARSTIDYSRAELLFVGVIWTVLTVGFEFLVGALEGTPVSAILAQYNVFAGQVWILVPLTLLTAPLLFGAVLTDH